MSEQRTSAVLYLDGVSVSFDGYRAIRNLSLVIEPGEMRAIIGPNGAGKTTMMDIVTGKTRPDEGDVLFDGGKHDLTKLDETAIAELGIGRRDRLAGEISHGQKQWLEIGMLLAQDPAILLVDEPVAGMTDAETEQTAALLRDINKSHTVIVVEHDMSFVRALDCKVTCLHEGSVLSEGTLDKVASDDRVIEVYLGR